MLNKNLLLFGALGYTLTLGILSLVSNDNIPYFGTNYEDKVYHLVAYALLTFLWYKVFAAFHIKNSIFIAFIISVIYGIIIEVLQGQLTDARDSSILDVIANMIGVAIVTLILTFRMKTITKKI